MKIINCVGCPKFCEHEDLNELKKFIDKSKAEGHEQIKFNCQIDQQIIKNFNG